MIEHPILFVFVILKFYEFEFAADTIFLLIQKERTYGIKRHSTPPNLVETSVHTDRSLNQPPCSELQPAPKTAQAFLVFCSSLSSCRLHTDGIPLSNIFYACPREICRRTMHR